MYRDIAKHLPVVQKYGGTSVGSVERIQAVARRVCRHHHEGWKKLAIVVSAMTGETNRLVALVESVNPRANRKHYDVAVSAGEQVSVGLTCAAIEACGVEAEPLLAYQLGIVTDSSHARAKIHAISPARIESAWAAGKVPVIAGFQGVTPGMDLTTLGRGGSDTSAVALAVALKAGFCEINTDVDGMYTADPRYVKTARLIERLDYETALELAALGSKVLHSRCVEVAAKYRMPLTVRNSFEENGRKTTIMAFSDDQALEAPVVSGVTVDENVAKLTVEGRGLAEVFSAVAANGINVDIIVHDYHGADSRFGFTVQQGDAEQAAETIEKLGHKVSIERGLAKVSAVGLGMKSHPGVASRVFETLLGRGIDVVMISTSEIKVSCVVPLADGKRAAQALHDAFF